MYEKWRGNSLGVYHRYRYQYQWKYHQSVGYYYQPHRNQPNSQHDNFPKALFPYCTSVAAAAAAALHPNTLHHLKLSLQTQHSTKTQIKLNQTQNKQHKDKLLLARVTNHCETQFNKSFFLIKLGKEKLLLLINKVVLYDHFTTISERDLNIAPSAYKAKL